MCKLSKSVRLKAIGQPSGGSHRAEHLYLSGSHRAAMGQSPSGIIPSHRAIWQSKFPQKQLETNNTIHRPNSLRQPIGIWRSSGPYGIASHLASDGSIGHRKSCGTLSCSNKCLPHPNHGFSWPNLDSCAQIKDSCAQIVDSCAQILDSCIKIKILAPN